MPGNHPPVADVHNDTTPVTTASDEVQHEEVVEEGFISDEKVDIHVEISEEPLGA